MVMIRTFLLLMLMLFSFLGIVSAISCVADTTDKPGTCINSKYSFYGSSVYKACYFNPYYRNHQLWSGYTTCFATIRTSNLFSDAGTPVANIWSNNNRQLTECHGHNSAACDVYSYDGFTLSDSASDRGFCDSSDANCVKCDSHHVEIKRWIGGAWINGVGDGKCESGCGASLFCDERSPDNSYGCSLNKRVISCDSDCQVSYGACSSDCKADKSCNNKFPGDSCGSDYCSGNKLVDFNRNHVIDHYICNDDCACSKGRLASIYCEADCGADVECDDKNMGYHVGNSGCNDNCEWVDCGLFAWNDNEGDCFKSCMSSDQCQAPAVCDFDGSKGGIHTCVIDDTPPIVNILYPDNDFFNSSSISLSFTISDDVDPVLDCFYIIDNGSPVNMGSFSTGVEDYELITSEGDHSIYLNCFDDAGNSGVSDYNYFRVDVSAPLFSNQGWHNLTVIRNNLITFLDVLNLTAYWTDNFNLNYSVLWTNRSGEWLAENTSPFNLSPSGWSNFTIDLTGDGDKTISWKIVVNDSLGNVNETDVNSFYVWDATKDFSVVINTVDGELSFIANGQPTTNASPVGSFRTALLGDLTVTHEGVGLPIDITFWIDDSLGSDFTLKANEFFDYDSAIVITTDEQVICHDINPGDDCQIWVWLDWTGEAPIGLISNRFNLESYFS